jgi:hypothetical protein
MSDEVRYEMQTFAVQDGHVRFAPESGRMCCIDRLSRQPKTDISASRGFVALLEPGRRRERLGRVDDEHYQRI